MLFPRIEAEGFRKEKRFSVSEKLSEVIQNVFPNIDELLQATKLFQSEGGGFSFEGGARRKTKSAEEPGIDMKFTTQRRYLPSPI